MEKSDFNPRTLQSAFEREVHRMLREILTKLEAIERQMPDPRGFPDPRE